MELIQKLTNQLGIDEEQAKGASGLLFKMAKEKLAPDQFSQVSNSLPEVEELMSFAPESGGIAGVLGGLTSKLGGSAGQLGDLASLAGGFKSLNMDSSLIGKFVPIVLSFVESKGDSTVKSMLANVFKE